MIYRSQLQRNAGGSIGILFREPRRPLTVATVNGYRELRPETLKEWHAIPWAGIEYNVREANLLLEAAQAFGMERLADVHQIDKKSHPFLAHQHPFPMCRFGHSFDVAVIHELLFARHEQLFTDQEQRSGVIASLLHDLLTAAGGEKTKIQNLRLFDEDANFGSFLESDAWKQFALDHDLDTAFVHQVILETNTAGELKDVADKIAYTCRDSHALLSLLQMVPGSDLGAYQRILDLIGDHPDIGEIWKHVEIENGSVVFRDAEGLARFLLLRALMSDLVYQTPRTRRAAYVFDEVVTRFLFDHGELTYKSLLTMTDTDLDQLLDHYLEFEPTQPDPQWREFKTRAEAEAFEQELIRGGVIFSVVEDLSHAPKPATQFLVATRHGPTQLRSLLPIRCHEIESICQCARWIKVGWLADPICELKTGVREQIQQSRLKRHKLAS